MQTKVKLDVITPLTQYSDNTNNHHHNIKTQKLTETFHLEEVLSHIIMMD